MLCMLRRKILQHPCRRSPRGRQGADSAAARGSKSVFQTVDVKRIRACVNAFDLSGFRHGEQLAVTDSRFSKFFRPRRTDTSRRRGFALLCFNFTSRRAFVYLTAFCTPTGITEGGVESVLTFTRSSRC